MPPRRTRAPSAPVEITLDGEKIVADAKASLASALVGAGHLALARSPKFHRPRGPACMRGGCDGCLMRVDETPNVMSCAILAHDGARVERQNVVGSASLDLLRATDWFFPEGMNHHEMFAGIPGVQGVMLSFARRVSGLGKIPDRVLEAARGPIPVLRASVAIVGAGAAGLSLAAALGTRGIDALLFDEHGEPGGSLGYFADDLDGPARERAALVDRAKQAHLHLSTAVAGVLEGDDWLLDRAEGMARASAKVFVVATGGHDGVPEFVGNDLPGVVSARAAGRLLREGVLVGESLVVAGEGAHALAYARAAGSAGAKVVRVADASTILRARGLSRVAHAELVGGRRVVCDAIIVDLPVAPSFELASEAGAKVEHGPSGYAVSVDGHGRTASARALYALGEVTGTPLDVRGFAAAAERVATRIAEELAR